MKNQWEINPGDHVAVSFNGGGTEIVLCRNAEVMNKPQATGDSWIFKDTTTGYVHYVSEGCTVSKAIQKGHYNDL